jgi:hypothetical protein
MRQRTALLTHQLVVLLVDQQLVALSSSAGLDERGCSITYALIDQVHSVASCIVTQVMDGVDDEPSKQIDH